MVCIQDAVQSLCAGRQDLVKVNPLSKLTLSDRKAEERIKRKVRSSERASESVSTVRRSLHRDDII